MRFEGCEDEVRLNLHQQEFSEYAWWPFEEVNEKVRDAISISAVHGNAVM